MDEVTLKKILERTGRIGAVTSIKETTSECSCKIPCDCKPLLVEEQEEETHESSKTTIEEEEEEEEDLNDNSTILSEDDNLAYRKRVLCDRKAKPFTLKWCFGVRVAVPVINLSHMYRGLILYAASNVGVIYDFIGGTMRLLHGHKNLLKSLSAEEKGNFIVTADNGEDSTIIVWDANTCIPIHTIFNKPEDYNTDCVALSQKGKYLISITITDCIKIMFWLWTYGLEEPNDVMEVASDVGSCVNICFHPNCQEHIMIAFDKQIMFLYWDERRQVLIETAFPTVRRGKSQFSGCTYVENCHECVASTYGGCILVFGNTLYARNYDDAELDNSKYYVKRIRITKCSINCIRSTDGLIVTGDDLGRIFFFDKRIKLLYWLSDFNVGPIVSLSFHISINDEFYSDSNFDVDLDSLSETPTRSSEDIGYEDMSDMVDVLVPSDATLARNPFVVKEFIILTKDGSVNLVIPVINELVPIAGNNDSFISAIDTHYESPYLVVGYMSGKLSMYNYISHDLISKYFLPNDANNEPIPITCIKYSPMSVRLACGRANGELWFLEPILLKNIHKPIQTTTNKVEKICFSPDSMFAAYYDSNMTVVSLYFDQVQQQWFSCGKVRSHYKPIRDIMFSSYKSKWKLMTVGEDRCLIQYNIDANCTGILDIDMRERVEQSAIPYCFVYYPIQEGCKERYILLADNQYKYKLITDSNFMIRRVILGPAYGCYQEYPVRKLIFMPDKKYLIFMTNRYIGFQLIPTDGSPFNYIGMICHSKQLADCCLSADGKYLFSFGKNERVIFMFKTNPKAADFVATAGGPELEPFYCLIEGGSTGWLFSEMKDLFYYMQILHQGENTVLPRVVSDTIPIVELADLMKACGYYPSEYDTETLIIDAKYRYYDFDGEVTDTISFVEFVKLYLNHRPPHGITKERLERAFHSLQIEAEETKTAIEKNNFIDVLSSRGEAFGGYAIQKCLRILLNIQEDMNIEETNNFRYLPESIDFDYLSNDILGIDMERNFDQDEEPAERRNTTTSQ